MKNPTKVTLLFILLYSLSLLSDYCLAAAQNNYKRTPFDVGIVLDFETPMGKMSARCISMALADFYTTHSKYSTKLNLHWRDSNQDNVDAASMGMLLMTFHLLTHVEVMVCPFC